MLASTNPETRFSLRKTSVFVMLELGGNAVNGTEECEVAKT